MAARHGAALISVVLLAGCDRLEDLAERPVSAVVISPQKTQSSVALSSIDNPRVMARAEDVPAYFDQLQRCRIETAGLNATANKRNEELAALAILSQPARTSIDINPSIVAAFEQKKKAAIGACLKKKGYIVLD